MQSTAAPAVHTKEVKTSLWLRLICAILLLAVAYIHLGLFLRMISFHVSALGVLFGLNALAALIATVAILLDRRWLGYVFGTVVAGVAGIIRLAMDVSPSLSASILGNAGFGGRFAGSRFSGHGFGRFKGFKGKGHFPSGFHGSFYPGTAGLHAGLLPAVPDAAIVSIIIEFVFVILAVAVLVQERKRQATPSGTAASLN